uniref:Cell division protein FtsZ n=1 Tax=candidate division CPR3 bacterium TaxID=2268181 RepID=A0A7C5YYP0_UNCC3
MLVKPENQNTARIVVVGVGGGGCNAVNTMISDHNIQGVDFVAINTDVQALQNSLASTTVPIGSQLTKGLGSGGDPEIGRKAAEEDIDKLHELLTGADMVFVTAGMGGGTGTGASPIIAGIAKNLGALTVGVVTTPFEFEGKKRMENALMGIEEMKDKVDTLIVIPNERLLKVMSNQVSFVDALKQVDDVLARAIKAITHVVTVPGLVNRDFADVRAIMHDAGRATIGMGTASGERRVEEATRQAIESPLLDLSITGAEKALLSITGSENFTLQELNEAASIIRQQMSPEGELTFGATIDSSMEDQISVTVLAAGFKEGPSIRPKEEGITGTTEVGSVKERHFITKGISYNIPRQDQATSPSQTQTGIEEGGSIDEEELDVPAFMRRQKK